MSDEITLTQGSVTAKLFDVFYSPAEEQEEDGTVYVIEEGISASSDVKLQDGEAVLSSGGKSWPVTVLVMEFDDEEDEGEDGEGYSDPACYLQIESEGTDLEALAEELGLEEG